MAKSIQLIRNDLIDRLEEYLQERKLAPGARLPSERELCELWRCNRVTLRAALRKLIDAGRLYQLPGSGTFLAAPKIRRNLWQFCSFSEAMQAEGYVLTTRLVAFARVEAPKRIAESLEVPLGTRLWRIKRLRIVDDVPLALETAWIPVDLARSLDQHDLERASLYATLETHFGIELMRSYEDLSTAKAAPEDAGLLQVAEDTELLVLEGAAFDRGERPVEFSRALTRGDRCCFMMRVGKEAEVHGSGPDRQGPPAGFPRPGAR